MRLLPFALCGFFPSRPEEPGASCAGSVEQVSAPSHLSLHLHSGLESLCLVAVLCHWFPLSESLQGLHLLKKTVAYVSNAVLLFGRKTTEYMFCKSLKQSFEFGPYVST